MKRLTFWQALTLALAIGLPFLIFVNFAQAEEHLTVEVCDSAEIGSCKKVPAMKVCETLLVADYRSPREETNPEFEEFYGVYSGQSSFMQCAGVYTSKIVYDGGRILVSFVAFTKNRYNNEINWTPLKTVPGEIRGGILVFSERPGVARPGTCRETTFRLGSTKGERECLSSSVQTIKLVAENGK